MKIKFLKTKHKLLAYCIEDWMPLFFLEAFVREFYFYKQVELVKNQTLEIIEKLLEDELIKAGDLLPGNIFKPWNENSEEIIKIIRHK